MKFPGTSTCRSLLFLTVGLLGWASPEILSAQSKSLAPVPSRAIAAPVAKPVDLRPASRFDGYSGVLSPKWKPDMMVSLKSSLNEMIAAPWFDGASIDDDIVNLPYHDLVVQVAPNEELLVIGEQAEGTEELNAPAFRRSIAECGFRIESDWYPSQRVVVGEIEIREGKHFQHLRIYPIRVSAMGDRIEKSQVVTYSITKQKSALRRPTSTSGVARSYASNSVLSNGSWYKLATVKDGIYRLDYSYFQSLGVDPANINPNTIRIHGNGGGMMPQIAGEFPHDDLVENAIYVSGGNDGRFDNGDFVLFYGQGPHSYKYVSQFDRFQNFLNCYSDSSFYFLTWGGTNGRRMTSVASAPNPNFTPTETRVFQWHQLDNFNPLTSGRSWLGETFDLTTKQSFAFAAPRIVNGTTVNVTTRLAGRSNSSSNFILKENTTTYSTISIPNTQTAAYDANYYRIKCTSTAIPANNINDGAVNIELEYVKPDASSVGYLDYIEVEYRSALHTDGNATFYFHAIDNVGLGQVFAYNIQGTNAATRVWDITDPVNVVEQSINNSGSSVSFNVACPGQKRFIAFSGNFLLPASSKRIDNQNLHALPQVEYLMITHPSFKDAANALARFHLDTYNRQSHVVDINQVYNEFSSGRVDPAAIRDFVKMFYDRAAGNPASTPKYLLLVGDGSYDYRGRSNSISANYIPTYQSRKSSRNTESYTSDDFYGFLDDGEGFWGENASVETAGTTDFLYLGEGDASINTHGLDIALGRLPVTSTAQANSIVQKIIRYKTNPDGLGPWRNRILLVADHKDGEGYIHLSQADSYDDDIEAVNPCINVDKIYMDNYTMENTASGSKFPDGRAALLQGLAEGSLLVNYTGHGGEIAWSNATILDISDINSIQNGNRLPAFITATCEFGRWDDPSRVSGGEALFLNENGGAIAMFTTVRVVYSQPNYILNQNFYKYILTEDPNLGRMPTVGEVFKNTKNDSWLGGINNRNFSLMGDPAIQLEYPEYKSLVTTINGITVVDTIVDTLGALSLVTIAGEVQNESGQLLNNFNGDLYISVFDKPAQFTTKRAPFTFLWQKNKIFVGEASVTNGLFSFQFVVPIDISYESGYGKISLYASNGVTDAAGCNRNLAIGGSGQGTISDDKGPELELFMNNEKFVDGGMVGNDPIMLADIFDDNGLNTVGTGIGHELTAILDGNDKEVIILNDFYSASRNSYQNGKITYPFYDLAPGPHELEVKVWDVANNSNSARVSFVVADDALMALGHVLNYPNPFTTHTQFFVEHNRNGSVLDVQVRIYTVSGRLVKTLQDNFLADGNLYCDMTWDGLDDYGDAISRGVYVYQVMVQDQTQGGTISKFEKLVVLR